MNSEVEPTQKKMKKATPSPSLPNELVVSCLARISRLYYPKLTLVCNNFGSLCISKELSEARFLNQTNESFFHVCLKLSNTHRPTWYTLWINPNKTNAMLLVPSPSSYFPRVPDLVVMVGSDSYGFNQSNDLSRVMRVCSKEDVFWRRATDMTVARENPLAYVVDGKIYVMGGCESIWAEVFDTKTKNWEPLPDPGSMIRSSTLKRIDVIEGKLFLTSNNEVWDYVYYPKEGKWGYIAKMLLTCVIENICYSCGTNGCEWYDTKSNQWRVVRGLSVFNESRNVIEIANYCGKLLILRDELVNASGNSEEKNICCVLVELERRSGDDEVWGNESSSIVLTVPSSYVFLRGQVTLL